MRLSNHIITWLWVFSAVVFADDFEQRIRPILNEYCITCHSTEKQKGDLDLERFTTMERVKKEPEVWVHALDQIHDQEMPPKAKRQPSLRMFGQSDRQVADTDADEGSIPQVLMLMNGEAQKVLRNPKSRVYATAAAESRPENQVESLYLSFFSRHPRADELANAKAALSDGLTLSDLTWVLFNSREFVFVQ